jgi:hypothetical protein
MHSLATLRYKIRYNPLPRLILNALKRVGITILPYYLFRRPLAVPGKMPDRGPFQFLELHDDAMADIAAMPMVSSGEQAYRGRLQQGQRCFGLRRSDETVAYCWMDSRECRVNGEWFPLRAGEVYAYDIYTLPRLRGQNLAPLLNACFSDMLRESGITTVYSVIDYYNRPSLNFAEKIGARAQRLNLYIRLFGLFEKSVVLKQFASDPAHDQAARCQRA